MPRGGRALTMASGMPAACSRAAAAIVDGASDLSVRTSVPSTSETTSLIVISVGASFSQCRPSRSSSAVRRRRAVRAGPVGLHVGL